MVLTLPPTMFFKSHITPAGGGTYGIVTAMTIQLQEYKPLEYVAYDLIGCYSPSLVGIFNPENVDFLNLFFTKVQSDFIINFLLDPTSLIVEPRVTKEKSNACSIVSTEQAFYGYGKNSGKRVAESWEHYWLGRKEDLVTKLTTTGEVPFDEISSEASIDTYAQCLDNEKAENKSLFTNFKDYLSIVDSPTGWTGNTMKRPIGPIFNNMYLNAVIMSTNVLIPKD